MRRPAWAEIDLDALRHNVREIRRIVKPGTGLMAVVKANAYGHGVVPVCRAALDSGVSWLGVALLQEALQLRRSGITAPIVVLGYTPDEDAAEVVANDISQTVFTVENALVLAAAARKIGRKARVHIKIDTGMSRLGFPVSQETLQAILRLAGIPELAVEGIYTHFATSDEADKSFVKEQFARFRWILGKLEEMGLAIPWKHCANSGAVIDLPETHLDLVRPGIILYGHYPSDQVRHDTVDLKPVMSLKARVAFVKEVPANTSISYGRIYYTSRTSRIATIPLGYADGYLRLLSNRGEVLVHGRRAPVVGRVCMDQMMVDVTDIPGVVQGDEVVLMGRQGSEEITAEELAKRLGTVNYELLCMISERVPRVYTGSSEQKVTGEGTGPTVAV